MIVLVDLDSVLNELWVTWSKAHNDECKICKVPLDYTTIDRWDVSQLVECKHDIYTYLKRRDIYLNAPVKHGAIEGTKEIQDMGHELYVVTASDNGEAIVGKHEWLRTHFPHIKKRNFIVANNKAMIRGDVIIDDHLDNLMHPAQHRILLDYGWNRTYEARHKRELGAHMRVYNWTQIVSYIESYS